METILYHGRFLSSDSPYSILEAVGIVADRLSGKIVKCYCSQAQKSQAIAFDPEDFVATRIIASDESVEGVYNQEFPFGVVSKLPEDCFAVPGFYDAHIHAIASGVRHTKGVDLSDSADWEAASKRLQGRIFNSQLQSGWLIAGGWRRTWFDDDAVLSPELLDETVSPDAKIYLREKDGHCVWLNSKAFHHLRSEVGDDELSAHEQRGHIRGGLLLEDAAGLAARLLPRLSDAEYVAAIRHIQAELLRRGVVGYQEAGLSEREISAYSLHYAAPDPDAAPAPPLPSVRCLLRQPPLGDLPIGSAAAASAAAAEALRSLAAQAGGGGRLRVDGLKLFLDGVVEERTAALLRPYQAAAAASGGGGEEGTQWSGRLLWADAALREFVSAAAASGDAVRTLHLHAIGDAAVRQAVRAGAADRRPGPGPARLDMQVSGTPHAPGSGASLLLSGRLWLVSTR